MDESLSIKAKRRKFESDVGLCIICLIKKPKESVIKEPKLISIKNLLSILRERYRYCNSKVAEFISRTKEGTGTDIISEKEKYHRYCYRDVPTKVKKERAKDRYKDTL